jgi:hypothetical protein
MNQSCDQLTGTSKTNFRMFQKNTCNQKYIL